MSHPNFTLEPGCYIDGSVYNVDDFNREIISFAEQEGFIVSPEDRPLVDGEEEGDWGSLDDIADEAVDFLNSIKGGDMALPEGWFWTIDESCLMLIEGEEEEWERDMGTDGVIPE